MSTYRWWCSQDAERQRREASEKQIRAWIEQLRDSSYEGLYSEDSVTHICKLYEELLSRKK